MRLFMLQLFVYLFCGGRQFAKESLKGRPHDNTIIACEISNKNDAFVCQKLEVRKNNVLYAITDRLRVNNL